MVLIIAMDVGSLSDGDVVAMGGLPNGDDAVDGSVMQPRVAKICAKFALILPYLSRSTCWPSLSCLMLCSGLTNQLWNGMDSDGGPVNVGGCFWYLRWW